MRGVWIGIWIGQGLDVQVILWYFIGSKYIGFRNFTYWAGVDFRMMTRGVPFFVAYMCLM